MRVLRGVDEARAFVAAAPRPHGLVPTMGALHDGHLALVRAARDACATVVASLFVNPTQFNDPADLAAYPRNADRDLALFAEVGVDAVFAPSEQAMYPPSSSTTVHVGGPALPLEGEARPGHFDGVATVVAKLLSFIMPDAAYFGQKDGQQVAVVRRLVADLGLPVEVRVIPTVREPDGLALSSRNALLSPEQRRAAPALYAALTAGAKRWCATHDVQHSVDATAERLAAEPSFSDVDYVALVDAATMAPWDGRGTGMLAAAAHLGPVRLIDNVLVEG